MSRGDLNWARDTWRRKDSKAQRQEHGDGLGHMLGRGRIERDPPRRSIDPAITMPRVSILKGDWDGKTGEALQQELEGL